jgi:hypothetical protein
MISCFQNSKLYNNLAAYSPANRVYGSTKEAYVNLILDAIHENYK